MVYCVLCMQLLINPYLCWRCVQCCNNVNFHTNQICVDNNILNKLQLLIDITIHNYVAKFNQTRKTSRCNQSIRLDKMQRHSTQQSLSDSVLHPATYKCYETHICQSVLFYYIIKFSNNLYTFSFPYRGKLMQ